MALESTHVLQVVVNLACAALYAWVGFVVFKRGVSQDARLANVLFATWWFGLAAFFVLVPAYIIPVRALGYHNVTFAVVFLDVLLLFIVAAIWGLAYYLVYLFTGKRGWFWPVTIFYFALEGLILGLVAYLQPNGFDANGNLTYAREQLVGAPAIILGLLYSVPVILAALGYASLYFRSKEPTARYRVALVSGGFLVQFGWSAISTILQLNRRYPNSTALSLVGDAVAVLAAICVLLAFRPPDAIRKRLERRASRRAS